MSENHDDEPTPVLRSSAPPVPSTPDVICKALEHDYDQATPDRELGHQCKRCRIWSTQVKPDPETP